MLANVGALLIGLTGEYVLPFLVEEAARYAAQKVLVPRLSAATQAWVGPQPPPPLQRSTSRMVVSVIPGRLRMRLTSSRSMTDIALLLDALRILPGVTHASLNPLTGNALVRFDPGTIGADRIVGIVEAFLWPVRFSAPAVAQRRGEGHLALV